MPNRQGPTIAVAKSKLFFRPPISADLLIVILLLASLSVASSVAQEPPKPPDSTQETPKPPDSTPEAPKPPQTVGEQVSDVAKKPVQLFNLLDRKSIVFPDIAANTTPLPPTQKFKLFVDNSISVHTIAWSMLGSAVGQADDSPTGFGEGWDAYSKRFGSSMARQASAEFFGTFIFASALHQDPRFFPEINPAFFHAVKYSVKRVFIARNDDGRDGINVSGLLGPLFGEGLANAYWPDRNRTVGDTFFRYGLDLATRAGGNMLREYWPTVYRKLGRPGSSASRR